MLRKDKNGNETGLTGLKRNVQKEPPKKFYLRGMSILNQSICCNRNKLIKKILYQKKRLKNFVIYLSRTIFLFFVHVSCGRYLIIFSDISQGLITMDCQMVYIYYMHRTGWKHPQQLKETTVRYLELFWLGFVSE